ncbi:MAG: hypothetical protein ACE5DW_04920 [Thermodesulfobacteriota bacterium]
MIFPYSDKKFSGKGKALVRTLGTTTAFFLMNLALYNYAQSADPTVIELHQTPCTIIEAEVHPRTFVSNNINDCIAINKETAGKRPFIPLRLKAGKTVFRVTNDNVPYPLGFWVRGRGVGRLTLPSVSGGGLSTGATKDYVIDLKPGKYLYSCPLNPTPDYPLIVE